MGRRNPAVDHYLQHTPTAQRRALEVIRDLIHSIQPDVSESVQYNMPLFDYHGLLCGFASEPHRICLYCRAEIVERYRQQFGKLDISKGCIRFGKLDDLPLDTLRAFFVDSCNALQNRFSQTGEPQTSQPQRRSP